MRAMRFLLVLIGVTFFLSACGVASGPKKGETVAAAGHSKYKEQGKATYYADKYQGHSTRSGEKYDRNQLTAAHPTLPDGTWVRVTNLANGKIVVVRINDHFPAHKGRIIDLSKRAFKEIAPLAAGVVDVEVESVD